MATVRCLSKKEANLQQRPWITHGILVSIKERDRIHKSYAKEVDLAKKKICLLFIKLKET